MEDILISYGEKKIYKVGDSHVVTLPPQWVDNLSKLIVKMYLTNEGKIIIEGDIKREKKGEK